MKRAPIIAIALILNGAIYLMAISPALVTWAHAAPTYIMCSVCNSAEVQEALAAAVDVGRMHVLSLVRTFSWPVIALCIANVALTVAASWRRSSNQPMEPTR